MPAPQGNRFWEVRSSHGRKPIFDEPDVLWEAATEYFEWCEDNPLMESKLATENGKSIIQELPKMRAMTESGLYMFIDICEATWTNYCSKDDFLVVTKAIKEIIRNQKFTGAAAGFLNANIIARDLGLKEASTSEHSGSVDLSGKWTIEVVNA